jgi:hypothetical protein
MVAVSVAVCSGVGLHGRVAVAEGLGVFVGVGVTLGAGAMMDNSGQLHPDTNMDTSKSAVVAKINCPEYLTAHARYTATGLVSRVGEKTDAKGQLQPPAKGAAAFPVTEVVVCFLLKTWQPLSPTSVLDSDLAAIHGHRSWSTCYLVYSNTMFSNWPATSQPTKSICTVSESFTGLDSLSTMSMRNVKGA